MAEDRPFSAEWTELEKIDFLLDELARAVERGQVHEASYRLLSPRYLTRREELVATISGQPRPQAADFSAFEGPPTANRPAERPRPASTPVAWTTVLLYLGAFLVIVASAVFAIAIWDLLGATGKLLLLGLVTAAFYVAGYFVRTRLEVPAGATALTAVASAMLLFDGWIAIRGYDLQGPLPWAVLLLVCSAVYWFTEVRLANRFFGVIGAAAQMGWWWLLGAGLGLPVITRLAGMALVAVAWQVAAERGRDDETVGSLARVLAWAAPIAVTVLTAGVVGDLALVRTAGLQECLAAAVVAGAAWFVLVRSRELSAEYARVLAAVFQLPLFAMVWVANTSAGEAWWMLAAFLGMSFAYGAYAIIAGRHPFAVLAVLGELSAVLLLLDLLAPRAEVWLVALAGLAAVWALASRMAVHAAELPDAPAGVRSLGDVAEWASVILLAGVSIAVPVVEEALPLGGFAIDGTHAAVAVAVLAAWAASTVIRTREAGLVGTALYSFYTLAAVMAWQVPELDPAYYAAGLVALAGSWLAGSRMLEHLYSPAFIEVLRWADRALLILIALVGLVLEILVLGEGDPTIASVTLAAATAGAFTYDALANRNVVAAGAASGFAVGTVALAVGTVDDPRIAQIATSLSGPAAAVLIVGGTTIRARPTEARSIIAAFAAAVMGTAIGLSGWGEPGWLALALLLTAVVWGLCAWRIEEGFAFVAGLALMGAAASSAAAIGAGTWPTVVLVGGATLALASVCLLDAFGPLGVHRTAGAVIGVAGLVGVAAVLAVAFLEIYRPADAGWLALGTAERTALLLVAAGSVLAQGRRWDVESAEYVGWGLVLLAVWNAWGDSTSAVGAWYTTTLALYLGAMAYLYVLRDRTRAFPVVLDAAAAVVGLGLPLLWALTAGPDSVLTHFLWVFALSVAFIGLGVTLKVRWYFFGGVTAIALVAVYRAFTTLAAFSWLLLGVIGVAMLVIAVTWEQQRSTRERLIASFQGWR